MKKIYFYCLLIIIGFYSQDALAAPHKLTSKAGKFSVESPVFLKQTTQVQPTAVGNIDIHIFTGEKADGTAYMVMYNDYPAEMISGMDPKETLNGARDGALGRTKGQLVNEKDLTLDGYPGKDLLVKVTKGSAEGLLKQRMFLVKNRLYQVMTVGPKQSFDTKEVDTFLNSFKLIK